MKNTFELLDAWPVGHITFGSEAGCDDQVLGFRSSTIGRLDVPATFVRIELGSGYNTFKGSVALDVENIVAMIEVISEFFVCWII